MEKQRPWYQPTVGMVRWVIGGLLFLGFALRVYTVGKHELAFDEVASFFIANRGPIELLTYVRGAIREHPPLYYVLLSVWMPLAGKSEFAIRFLSVMFGMVTVAVTYRVLKRITGQSLALLSTLLLVTSPLHVRISRDARMYGLLTLWTFLSIYTFVILLEREHAQGGSSPPQAQGSLFGTLRQGLRTHREARAVWVLFWLITGAGMFTHYFMVFVLLAEDLYLLLMWRRHRRLLPRWLAIHGVLGGVMVLWAVLSPGLWATLLSLWKRGAADVVRWHALARGLNGLYLGATLSPNWFHLGLLLLVTALGLLPLRRRESSPPVGPGGDGLLRGLLLAVPIIAVLALPERVSGRYLTPALPASILTMAVGLKRVFAFLQDRLQTLADGSRRVLVSTLVPTALLGGILYVDMQAYAHIYAPPAESFRARIDYLSDHARPDDGLLLHGPWQKLLLSYYDVGSLETYTIPLRDLKVEADQASATLEQILEAHERLWVSYDSVEPVDPTWIVSRWLHRRAHQVVTRRGVTLYYRSPTQGLPAQLRGQPADNPESAAAGQNQRVFLPSIVQDGNGYERVMRPDLSFGRRLQLKGVALSNLELTSGEAVLLLSQWRALRDIPSGLMLRIELVGPASHIWEDHQLEIGPANVGSRTLRAGDTLVERQGLLIPMGTPPGMYQLRLRVISPSGNEWLPEGKAPFEVATVRVQHHAPLRKEIEALPRHKTLFAEFEGMISLIGYAPWGHNFTQGNPLLFDIYWEALCTPDVDYDLEIEVVTDRGSVVTSKRTQPVAAWLPTSSWVTGDVLKGHYVVPLPADAEPGPYQIRLSVATQEGSRLTVEGTRTHHILDWWERQETVSGTSLVLFGGRIEPRPRLYRAPVMNHHTDVVLSDSEGQEKVRLLGYDIASSSVEPGDSLELTLYWKTVSRMESIYAVFNHLVGPDGELRAQQDGWPQQGTYPTNLWLPGEVVEDHYTVQVPPETALGEYTLRVGMYDAATGDRLLVAVDGEQVPERHAELITVSVTR